MKTISLDEAFQQATKGPLASVPLYKNNGHCLVQRTRQKKMIAAIRFMGGDNKEDLMNGALLAHCFNHFQEVVEALERCMYSIKANVEDFEDVASYQNGAQVLAKASTVEVPE